MDLIDKLIARQLIANDGKGLNDREMADQLGITRSMWARIRLGIYPGIEDSMALVRGVIRGFPELTPEALFYLRDGVPESTEKVQAGNESKGSEVA